MLFFHTNNGRYYSTFILCCIIGIFIYYQLWISFTITSSSTLQSLSSTTTTTRIDNRNNNNKDNDTTTILITDPVQISFLEYDTTTATTNKKKKHDNTIRVVAFEDSNSNNNNIDNNNNNNKNKNKNNSTITNYRNRIAKLLQDFRHSKNNNSHTTTTITSPNNYNNNDQLLFDQHQDINNSDIHNNDNHNNNNNDMVIQPRNYPYWKIQYNQSTLPCYRPTTKPNIPTTLWANPKLNHIRKEPVRYGMFFVKLCKTASSTAASIHIRIARNEANRQHNKYITNTTNNTSNRSINIKDADNNNNTEIDNNEYWPVCLTRHLHGSANRLYKFMNRIKHQSFLWTMVREPTQRYISEFFHFRISRKHIHPTNITDEMVIDYIKNGKHSDQHYLSWLALHQYHYSKTTTKKKQITTIKNILNGYDFIGITERFDESIVVLMLLLDLSLGDILYISSKTNGGWDYSLENTNQCVHIQKSFITSGVQDYLNSPEWTEYIYAENLLYTMANYNLDFTIDHTIGRGKFQYYLQQFQLAQQKVDELCSYPNQYIVPCHPITGIRNPNHDCYQLDMGCGFHCLDQVANEFNLWGKNNNYYYLES